MILNFFIIFFIMMPFVYFLVIKLITNVHQKSDVTNIRSVKVMLVGLALIGVSIYFKKGTDIGGEIYIAALGLVTCLMGALINEK